MSESLRLVQPVPDSGNKEICPICTKEGEWEARPDRPAQETYSGSAAVCLPPTCGLSGLTMSAQKSLRNLKHEDRHPTSSHHSGGRSDEPND